MTRNNPLSGIDRVIARKAARRPLLGCDQQGRLAPAEACTELGVDEIDPRASAIFWNAYAAIATVAVVAAASLFL